ncbi:hypothetical protein AM588_10004708 [Phytophthora nicotianae]|uniref:RING-type domain-containing protein n=1 Tax=Phytophthora nicotianae TaxID=4792 RepID=A0A0W8DDU6_PHYNI|nr:hypothetical protein AM588_10004708 [Phytophthora nicotianae]
MADYEEEPDCCPLCMEELDITDQTFNACPCGYQVCLWCWHQIKNEYNGLCPACRQPYAELSKQKNPLDREDTQHRIPPLSRGHSYSNIVAGGHSSSSYAASAPASASVPVDPVPNKKPDLRVDTSREEDKKQAVETVVGPLEALKLATGSSTEQPAWAQPFPTPVVSQNESEETNTGDSSAGVYSPFGLGFDGGIRRASSAKELTSKTPVSGDVWGSSTTTNTTLDSFPSAAPAMSASASSSSSFASIDAIFSQHNDSSEALAGLLGVQLSSNPLAQPLAAPTKEGHTSRFSFANPADSGRMQTTAHYELLDGTTVNNRSSFGGFDVPRSGNASTSSGFPATDRSGFPPLGSSQHHMPPPHPSRSSFSSDFRSNDLPLGGSSALGGESGGLAFLQQMLPNVNISFGGTTLVYLDRNRAEWTPRLYLLAVRVLGVGVTLVVGFSSAARALVVDWSRLIRGTVEV